MITPNEFVSSHFHRRVEFSYMFRNNRALVRRSTHSKSKRDSVCQDCTLILSCFEATVVTDNAFASEGFEGLYSNGFASLRNYRIHPRLETMYCSKFNLSLVYL